MTRYTSIPISGAVRLKGFILLILLAGCIVLLWPRPSPREVDILIPVVPENVAPGYTIMGMPLKPLEVRLQGSPADLALATETKLHYRLDLSDLRFGVHALPVRASDIALVKGVSIVRIRPEILEIVIDREIEKVVPIQLVVTGKPAEGFIQTDTRVRPSDLQIRGPQSVLETIDVVHTTPVDINGLTTSLKKEIALAGDHPVDITLPGTPIVVEITIKEMIATKVFRNHPINAINTPYRYQITPARVHLTLKGAVGVLNSIDAEKDIDVYLDLKDLKPGVYVRRAVINLPVKTRLAGVQPQLFTVKLERP
jgi:YbbR domain-containing protein